MRHTFLLEPGEWYIRGVYYGQDGEKLDVEGETRIAHGDAAWSSDGQLRIGEGDERILGNRYEIAPMPEGGDHTTWVCADPAEGTIRGAITVVDDCVISSFRAEATDYHGVDVLRKAKQEYRSRGFAMKDGVKLSSWALTIRKS